MSWLGASFWLPLPPSANALVRPAVVGGFARLVKTQAAKQFRERAHAVLERIVASNPDCVPMPDVLELHAVFSVPTIASDGPNRMKALEDALKGFVYLDDRQLGSGTWRKVIGEPSVLVTVTQPDDIDPEFAKRLSKANGKPTKPTNTELKRLATPAVYR